MGSLRLIETISAPPTTNYVEFLLAPEPGLNGLVSHVESHCGNPFTRYSVVFNDGSSANGLLAGRDLEFTVPRTWEQGWEAPGGSPVWSFHADDAGQIEGQYIEVSGHGQHIWRLGEALLGGWGH